MTGSGEHPMRGGPGGTDADPMMALDTPPVVAGETPAAPGEPEARFARGTAAEPRLARLRAQVAAGAYRPDEHAVAAAVLTRVPVLAQCSKPRQASAPGGALRQATPGDPATTAPTQVSPAASAASREPGGTQAHSS